CATRSGPPATTLARRTCPGSKFARDTEPSHLQLNKPDAQQSLGRQHRASGYCGTRQRCHIDTSVTLGNVEVANPKHCSAVRVNRLRMLGVWYRRANASS